MMQIKFQLIDELIAIDERLHADFAKGEVSDKCRSMIKRFELHLIAYCKSRKFHCFSNKKLLSKWIEFKIKCFEKYQKPIRLYETQIYNTPESLGLTEKLDEIFSLLY